MPQPYDSATKFLLDNPADWLPLVHRPVAEATPLNSDLSTITASADKLFRVHSEPPYVLHLELQSTYQTRMAERFMMYNVLIHYREQLPVLSVVVLLRPEADGTCMREPVRLHLPDESESYLRFRFEVVRLWEIPVEQILSGGIHTLPLAPLCRVSRSELPSVIERMRVRIGSEVSGNAEHLLWTATYLLMGMRYNPEEIEESLKGVRAMRESITYQAILNEGRTEGRAEGRTEGELRALLLFGKKRLGEPSALVLSELEGITTSEPLERMILRISEVESWSELLQEK